MFPVTRRERENEAKMRATWNKERDEKRGEKRRQRFCILETKGETQKWSVIPRAKLSRDEKGVFGKDAAPCGGRGGGRKRDARIPFRNQAFFRDTIEPECLKFRKSR